MGNRGVKKRTLTIAYICLLLLFLSACGEETGQSPVLPDERADTGFVLFGIYDYDSADTPVFVSADAEAGTLTFFNLTVGKRYTLSYDGTSGFYDKYGQTMSVSQFTPGTLVDLKFVKGSKHLTSMSLSKDAWLRDATDEYRFDPVKQEVTIGSEVLKISREARYFSGGEEIPDAELNEADTLSFSGIGSTVYSVLVENGHGYLRLKGQEYFVGGWIEVGSRIFRKVTEDMLLTVPEGRYQVIVSNAGTSAERTVQVRRGEESELDLSDVEIEKPKIGMVLFSLTPSDAELYVDGEKTDPSGAVEMSYGLHQIICRASGYRSLTQYISVGQESAGINIVLETADAGAQEEETQVPADTTTSYYQVHIGAPEGASCYLDGSYVGIVPCSFRKTEGTHTITLARQGYLTRSYTISVDGEDKDVSFSFVELITEEQAAAGGGASPDAGTQTGTGTDPGNANRTPGDAVSPDGAQAGSGGTSQTGTDTGSQSGENASQTPGDGLQAPDSAIAPAENG